MLDVGDGGETVGGRKTHSSAGGAVWVVDLMDGSVNEKVI